MMPTPQEHRSTSRSDETQALPVWERDPKIYYDRVMPAWRLLMGRNLHYGYFDRQHQDLDTATDNLTERIASAGDLRPGLDLLDVGCGDGQTSCWLAERFGCRIVGISTGKEGVEQARRLARDRG